MGEVQTRYYRYIQNKRTLRSGVVLLMLDDESDAHDNRMKSGLLCAHIHNVHHWNQRNKVVHAKRLKATDVH